ncbi:hypothetical protein ACFWBG_30255 [Nocardia salmonicida]|uniref:hypothetical protein n=1 Tax=Nocardia salmonicida TaxID=53431 RepID=UPI0036717406
MTLHAYGALNGVVMCMSDSLTTRVGLPLRTDTEKTVTYPLDPTTWTPGDLAAVVMTQGRSEFRTLDDPGNPIEASQVARAALARGPFVDIAELAKTVYAEFGRQMLTCPDCRQETEDQRAEFSGLDGSEDDDFEGACTFEIEGKLITHEMEIHIVGLEDPHQPRKRYARRWGGPPDATHLTDIPDRAAFRSGFLAPPRDDSQALTCTVAQPLARSSPMFEEMRQWFTATVKDQGLKGKVGGPIRTIILDPDQGFVRLENWVLPPSYA